MKSIAVSVIMLISMVFSPVYACAVSAGKEQPKQYADTDSLDNSLLQRFVLGLDEE